MNTVTIDSPTSSDSLMGDVKPSIVQPSVAAQTAKKGASSSTAPSSSAKKASFECTSCTRKFSTRSHLVRHSRVHTGERKYACDYPGCEMRCSRKDNLQQHYRTHLVVNPRRANAGQTLNLATDLVNSASSAPNPPLSVVPHHDSEPQIHHTPISPNPPSSHTEYAPQIHQIDASNPYRAGSMSPPPLGNAWDYWYLHGCLPGSGSGPSASSSGSGSSGATSPELQSNALELVPGQRPPHPHHHQHPHPQAYYPGPDGTALVQNHPFVPSDRRPAVDELSPPPTRHGHPTGAYSGYPAQEGYTYSQNESPISSVPPQSVARYTTTSQDYSQLYPQSNDRAPAPPSTSHAAVYMPYHSQQQQRDEYDDSQPPPPPTVVPSMSRNPSYHQAAPSQHPQGYHQYAATTATTEYPYSSSRYQAQGAHPQQVGSNHQNSHPQMYLPTAPAAPAEYHSANTSHEGSPAMRGQAAVYYTHHNSPALRHAVPQAAPIVQQDQYYPQSRPVTAHGHQESPQQSLVLPPIRQQYTSAPAGVTVSALPVMSTGMPAMGWDRVAVSDARVGR